MPPQDRHHPAIPDHEVLRKIGGGAYGEVWMARGVTGAYRAVKIVRREDFDDERGFEREFEGILKFEPISRDHPGLVNILHVGRDQAEQGDFYYYVMELGDDIRNGREINPVEYEARTLRSDITSSDGQPQSIRECIEAGILLAEALEHLHQHGLAHRDVKPANIIFVRGKAKLADIGLVADRGQRTFVGTEGFVPPEGPGSSQADVYSLGKVLYEVATGKDRLQFPELPEELHPDTDPKQWHGLNQIICDICNPRVSQRTVTSGLQLATALRRISVGKKPVAATKGLQRGVLWALLVAFTCYSSYLAYPFLFPSEVPSDPEPTPPVVITPQGDQQGEEVKPPEKKFCIVNFLVTPIEAEVYDLHGKSLGDVESYLQGRELEVGTLLDFTLRAPGYQDEVVSYPVPDRESDFPEIFMKLDLPPVAGKQWIDPLGVVYQPKGEEHISKYVHWREWNKYTEMDITVIAPEVTKIETTVEGQPQWVTLMGEQSALDLASWLTHKARLDGRLGDEQEIVALRDVKFTDSNLTPDMHKNGLFPVKLMARSIPYASFYVETIPSGASIKIDGVDFGEANRKLAKIPTGKWKVEISKDGYKTYIKEIEFEKGKLVKLEKLELVRNNSLIFGKPWKNKLGMTFVPVEKQFMVSAWETRVVDFKEYVKSEGLDLPYPRINNRDNEPVVSVSLVQAKAFAKWLTERDREAGLIGENYQYRLPTDREWSLLVGVEEKQNIAIPSLALQHQGVYPWNGGWHFNKRDQFVQVTPGAVAVGNFSDEIRKKWHRLNKRFIRGYSDGHAGTSPVGSYAPNARGIYDLAGNASEWVTDTVYDGRRHVARGSNYKSFLKRHLAVSHREYPQMESANDVVGFRVILEYKPKEQPTIENSENGRDNN